MAKKHTLPEEYIHRIDEAEQQMACGDIVSGEQVHTRMRKIINAL